MPPRHASQRAAAAPKKTATAVKKAPAKKPAVKKTAPANKSCHNHPHCDGKAMRKSQYCATCEGGRNCLNYPTCQENPVVGDEYCEGCLDALDAQESCERCDQKVGLNETLCDPCKQEQREKDNGLHWWSVGSACYCEIPTGQALCARCKQSDRWALVRRFMPRARLCIRNKARLYADLQSVLSRDKRPVGRGALAPR